MNYFEIINTIKNISLNHDFVYEFSEGDIYEYLNTDEHKYPVVFLTVNDINVSDYNTLNANLFYVDRLTDDNSNKLDIQSIGISIINSILYQLETQYNDVTLQTNQFVTFTEKFSDMCAGVYTTFSIEYSKENNCNVNYRTPDNNITTEIVDVEYTENGEFEIVPETGNLIESVNVTVNVPTVKVETMTQHEYDALSEHDPNTIYLIV